MSTRDPFAPLVALAALAPREAVTAAERPVAPPTLAHVRAHRAELAAAARAEGATSLMVAGSVARGEAGPDSDVDFVVRMPGDASLLALAGLHARFEAILGYRVDVVDVDRASPPLRESLLRDAVAV